VADLQIHNDVDNDEEVNQAFSVFDKHNDGMINIEELKHVLTRIGDPL